MGNLKDLKNTISAETRKQFIFFEIIRNHAVYGPKIWENWLIQSWLNIPIEIHLWYYKGI